jgi:peptidoglycan/LPS O-acetylase OafA/YrhL
MSNQGVNVVSSGSITLLQFPPDNIPIYWIQETEILMIAKGGDAMAQQISFASAGAFLGALPGAFAAAIQFSKDGKIELPSLIALLVACAGLIVAVVCASIHKRHKTYPDHLLAQILARKNFPSSN